MRIDLVIDAASPPPRADAGPARHLALERLIARGEPVALAAGGFESVLEALFEIPQSERLPTAALSLLGDGFDPGSADWLALDPVHLQASHTRLALVPLPPQDISPAELQALQEPLAPHLAASGYELVTARSGRWYLRSAKPLTVITQPPQACAGPLDETHMPAGPDGAALRRLVTEAQMLLHALPVNEAREAAGKLPVNGVWPWGNGRMRALPRSRYARVYSEDGLVRGIARAGGAQVSRLPEDAMGMTAQSAPGDRVLAVVSAASTSLQAIEQRWAEPLTRALSAGRAEELGLFLVGAAAVTARRLTRRHLRRWWRRSRPLAHA